jgi:hypothetical protein
LDKSDSNACEGSSSRCQCTNRCVEKCINDATGCDCYYKNCAFGQTTCSNRRLSRLSTSEEKNPLLEIYRTKKMRLGVRATGHINKEVCLGVYAGINTPFQSYQSSFNGKVGARQHQRAQKNLLMRFRLPMLWMSAKTW